MFRLDRNKTGSCPRAFAGARWCRGPVLVAACAALVACEEVPTSPELEIGPSLAYTAFPAGRIVYAREGDIWVMNSDEEGSDKEPLTNTPELEGDPALSADGRWVAYSRDGAIWRMSVNGLWQQEVFSGFGAAFQPAWSPDGTRIAFTFQASNSSNLDVYEIDPDGGNLTFPAADPQASEHSPTYNPANDSLTYVYDGHIVGGGAPGVYGSAPAWNPQGTMLAYHRAWISMHDNQQVYVVSHEDVKEYSNPTRVSANGHDETDPTWSPDGNKIAFQRQVYPWPGGSAGDADIWWMEAYAWRTLGRLAGGALEPASRTPSWATCGAVRFMPC